MLELITSDGDDGRSLSTKSPLGWDHGVLRYKEENYSLRNSVYLYLYQILYNFFM